MDNELSFGVLLRSALDKLKGHSYPVHLSKGVLSDITMVKGGYKKPFRELCHDNRVKPSELAVCILDEVMESKCGFDLTTRSLLEEERAIRTFYSNKDGKRALQDLTKAMGSDADISSSLRPMLISYCINTYDPIQILNSFITGLIRNDENCIIDRRDLWKIVGAAQDRQQLVMSNELMELLLSADISLVDYKKESSHFGSYIPMDAYRVVAGEHKSFYLLKIAAGETEHVEKVLFGKQLNPNFSLSLFEQPLVIHHYLAFEYFCIADKSVASFSLATALRFFIDVEGKQRDLPLMLCKLILSCIRNGEYELLLEVNLYLTGKVELLDSFIASEDVKTAGGDAFKFDSGRLELSDASMLTVFAECRKRLRDASNFTSMADKGELTAASYPVLSTDEWYNNYRGFNWARPIYANSLITFDRSSYFVAPFNDDDLSVELLSLSYIGSIIEMCRMGLYKSVLSEASFILSKTKGILVCNDLITSVMYSALLVEDEVLGSLEVKDVIAITYLLGLHAIDVYPNTCDTLMGRGREVQDKYGQGASRTRSGLTVALAERLKGVLIDAGLYSVRASRFDYIPSINYVVDYMIGEHSYSLNSGVTAKLQRFSNGGMNIKEPNETTLALNAYSAGIISPTSRNIHDFQPMLVAALGNLFEDFDCVSERVVSGFKCIVEDVRMLGINELGDAVLSGVQRLRTEHAHLGAEMIAEHLFNKYGNIDESSVVEDGSLRHGVYAGSDIVMYREFRWSDIIECISWKLEEGVQFSSVIILNADVNRQAVLELEIDISKLDKLRLRALSAIYTDAIFLPPQLTL